MSEQHQKTVIDTSLAAGTTSVVDIPVGVAETLIVAWTMTNAAAVGDLGVTSVKMFRPGSVTPLPNEITPTVYAPISVAGDIPVVSKVEIFNVTGLNKVRLSVRNAAGAARTTKVHAYTYSQAG